MDDILVARDTEESTQGLNPAWGQTPAGARQAG